MFTHFSDFHPFSLNHFRIETLIITSTSLAQNPLGDSCDRMIPVLVPQDFKENLPLVMVLAGFTGNSPFYFNGKFAEKNAVQILDDAAVDRKAPDAIYVFVDAMTLWGGSQFINSSAIGFYEDYIVQEVLPAVEKTYQTTHLASQRALVGGSSGGYGALHLGSRYPHIFGVLAAIAPDSFFEASLVPDLYMALPIWEKYQSQGLMVLQALRQGSLKKHKNFHHILNAFAMCACYLPKGNHGDFEFPLDPRTGLRIENLWKQLKTHDPIEFLRQRDFYRTQSKVYIDVGNKDQYHLHYGARQISQQMKEAGFAHSYSEFDGNHFDLGERRVFVWQWLQELWS